MAAPRPAGRLFVATFSLYRRYPLLFLVLAACVIVPYELIALAATGAGALSQGEASFPGELALTIALWAFVTPLVSSLHVHAVTDVRCGREPHIQAVAIRGLKVLPTVAAAAIVSGLGIALGYIALIVPGIILSLRWAVVAQSAAIEHEGWLPALRRSADLSDGHYMHIFIFIFLVGLIATAPLLIGEIALEGESAGAGVFTVGVVLNVITTSFAALASALLYYDLLTRWEAPYATAAGEIPKTSWDPRGYADQDRPKGWYVDPNRPSRMNYWHGPDRPEWHGTTRTPRKIKRAWEAEG